MMSLWECEGSPFGPICTISIIFSIQLLLVWKIVAATFAALGNKIRQPLLYDVPHATCRIASSYAALDE